MAGSELPIQPIGRIESMIHGLVETGQSFYKSHSLDEKNRKKIELKHVLQTRRNSNNHPGYKLIPHPLPGVLKQPPPHNVTVFKAELYEITFKYL